MPEVKVFFFREKIGKHKAKVEFHFYEGKLFLYTYTFSYLNKEDKAELIDVIHDKYLVNQEVELNGNYIQDESDNIILLNDKVEFMISYMKDKKLALDKISDYLSSLQDDVEVQQMRNKKILYSRLQTSHIKRLMLHLEVQRQL